MAPPIPKLKFSEPRHNLPGRKGIATAEDRFTISFARAYTERFSAIHSRSVRTANAMAREIPVTGYGIADLVAVAWEPGMSGQPSVESFLQIGCVTTRAFEFKIRDWRTALAQAARYRYFAHQSTVVLPCDVFVRARAFLDMFRKTRIGLWSFDLTKRQIVALHTPRPAQPKSWKQFVHTVKLVHRATGQALPIA